jgi:predicted AlkP superfamily pyrophosphatase or phosphodiesterase
MKKLALLINIFFIPTFISGLNTRPPRLTVVLVVDQFAYDYITKLYPQLKHGLRYLLDNGVVYTNAYMPHAQPSTATGHAGLNTGTCAERHGFIANAWYENGKKVKCDNDCSEGTFVFAPDGLYDFGRSSHRLMVDGLSDQCALQSQPFSNFAVYSISGKSRSAVATASKMGKAVWFDNKSGLFTSSQAYFDELPAWLQKFNRDHDINQKQSFTWKPMYPESPRAYNFFNIHNYEYTRLDSMINKTLPMYDDACKHKYHFFERSPQANQLILDCSLACIKQHVSRKQRDNRKYNDRLLLWVCLSPLDKVGHKYGTQSMEAIDMIYHLDKQIRRFIRQTLRIIGKHELVFALTADHAAMPIPQLLQEEGFTLARRLDRVKLVDNINQKMKEKYGVEGAILGFKCQELVLNDTALGSLDFEQRTKLMYDIKWLAMQEEGIMNAWLFDELIHLPTQVNTIEDHLKKQLFRGRSGSVILQTQPYTMITHWKEGAEHKTPYNYDTHVPLIIFHPGKFERKYVRQRVVALQLANTLAEILNVPKPSASMYDILPDLFDLEYQ